MAEKDPVRFIRVAISKEEAARVLCNHAWESLPDIVKKVAKMEATFSHDSANNQMIVTFELKDDTYYKTHMDESHYKVS
jgi:hypothetical protein